MRPAWVLVFQGVGLSVVDINKSTARNQTVQLATMGSFWVGV